MNKIISDSVKPHEGSKAGRRDGREWVGSANLDGMGQQRPPGGSDRDKTWVTRRRELVKIWRNLLLGRRNRIFGRGHSTCKGPEVRISLACLRNR